MCTSRNLFLRFRDSLESSFLLCPSRSLLETSGFCSLIILICAFTFLTPSRSLFKTSGFSSPPAPLPHPEVFLRLRDSLHHLRSYHIPNLFETSGFCSLITWINAFTFRLVSLPLFELFIRVRHLYSKPDAQVFDVLVVIFVQ